MQETKSRTVVFKQTSGQIQINNKNPYRIILDQWRYVKNRNRLNIPVIRVRWTEKENRRIQSPKGQNVQPRSY